LADDFSIDSRWFTREFETIDADHLRRQFMGHARLGENGAEGKPLAKDRFKLATLENFAAEIPRSGEP
jgi:hypothetical protein